MIIFESLTSIVYHATNIARLADILRSDAFYLTTSLGTKSDQLSKGKFYYLSLSSVKYGGFARGLSYRGIVMLVLDGDKLNQRYQGKPVDYWGAGMRLGDDPSVSPEQRYHAQMTGDENEERLLANKSEIPNASSYIKEIHVLIGNEKKGPDSFYSFHQVDDRMASQLGQAMRYAEVKSIPVYIYDDPSAFQTQFKKKAIVATTQKRVDRLTVILDLLRTKDLDSLPDDYPYDRLKKALGQGRDLDELITQVENTIHNNKTDPTRRKEIEIFVTAMRKSGCSTVGEFLRHLHGIYGEKR